MSHEDNGKFYCFKPASGSLRFVWILSNTNDFRLLDYTNNNTLINSQETPYLIANIAKRSHLGRKLAWQHIKNYWSSIFNKYNSELFLFSNMLSTVLSSFSTEQDLQEIEQFFSNQTDVGSGTKAVEQSKYKIKSNIMWNKVNSENLSKWLSRNSFFRIWILFSMHF